MEPRCEMCGKVTEWLYNLGGHRDAALCVHCAESLGPSVEAMDDCEANEYDMLWDGRF